MDMKIIVHTDGGSRGNPGKAAIGVVIEEVVNPDSIGVSRQSSAIPPSLKATDGHSSRQQLQQDLTADSRKLIAEIGKTIGETTNNVAEYTAVREALRAIIDGIGDWGLGIGKSPEISFLLDSLLVVQQLNGIFKIKDARLREIFFAIKSLEQEIGGDITYTHVPREENFQADVLVNKALDGELRG
jgi:ribonuclease HI